MITSDVFVQLICKRKRHVLKTVGRVILYGGGLRTIRVHSIQYYAKK